MFSNQDFWQLLQGRVCVVASHDIVNHPRAITPSMIEQIVHGKHVDVYNLAPSQSNKFNMNGRRWICKE